MRFSTFNPFRQVRGGGRGLVGVSAGVLVMLVCAGQASAAGVWQVRPVFAPAHIAPGASGELIVTATNLGGEAISASAADPVKVSAQLPAGVTATSIDSYNENAVMGGHYELPEMTCEQGTLTCEGTGGFVYPYESMEVVIDITVAASAQSGLKARLSVSGGGANPASSEEAIPISAAPLESGVERFEQVPLNADGSVDTQAGSHPFQLTTTLAFDQGLESEGERQRPVPLAAPKDLTFDLPPGLVGNPTSVPQCPISEFEPGPEEQPQCQPDTAIGVASVAISFHDSSLGHFYPQPSYVMAALYNLTPSPGEPARFGFVIVTGIGTNIPVYLDTSVRTGGDYGVVVSVHNISEQTWFIESQLSFWGVPGDPSHNIARGECLFEFVGTACTPKGSSEKEAPFLTLPASCTGLSDPLTTSMEATTWEQPGEHSRAEYVLHEGSGQSLGLDGCNRLGFDPSISVAPDSEAGSTPTGLTVGVHVPQEASLNPNGLAEASVEDTTVALPAGVALNPAAADGLESCSEAQVSLDSDVASTCPDGSKVGTVEISTPLLPEPLVGAAYLAAQDANPFGSLVALYIVAEDVKAGLLVKLAGEVKLDPVTGQIVSSFENTPQLPFEDLKLHFFGGDRAPLVTPAACGSYTTTASIAPWSGNASAESSSEFQVDSGPNGSACQSTAPFSPTLTAGTTNIQAGAFSPLTMTVSREDGQQNIGAIQLHMPPGLSGLLTGVELCSEARADAGSCGTNSLIGETTVSVGLGGDPYSVTGGKVYITGPYEGAPFGLSIVVPAKAGPYDLGTVVVRGTIQVDPTTSALTITTDTTGPYAIPHILDGIPLQIKHVNFTTTRPGFTFNPTNCDPMSVTGSLSSVEGATKALSVPFQVTNCAVLGFKPGFKVSTSGRTSRANGASLHVLLTYPKAAFGSQTNIGKVKVDLPKQLPSRLTTLQKACPDSTFNANPAACSSASRIGTAKATTPLIPVALEGPVYFVSHGGAQFPELIVVLSGYGVTVDLHSETFINKAGITSSTFRTIPDVPVGTFELTLPQGKYSALAANGNLCASKLSMPTAFTGQNGAEIHQSTPITVTGCPKHKAKKKIKKASKRHKGKTYGKKR